jgi:hypothetical protein
MNDIIAAWLLEDDLPFTTVGLPGFGNLLKFFECPFATPSDTTIRNQLNTMFDKMSVTVMREILV